jgi:hypothetical protein
MRIFLIILGVVLVIIGAFGLSGLLMWGIGSFIIWAFKISFVWTYWHGLAVAFIIWILSSIFKITINKD